MRRAPRSLRALAAAFLLGLPASAGCDPGAADAPRAGRRDAPAEARAPQGPYAVRARIAGRPFDLELAADPASRQRGLSGRTRIPEGTGMLFAFPEEEPRTFVMRDCPVPIDIAFLDSAGAVVSVHTMPVEPPRAPGESPFAYEARLPGTHSAGPARYAVEVAGGTFAALGLAPGDTVAFDREAVAARTR